VKFSPISPLAAIRKHLTPNVFHSVIIYPSNFYHTSR